MSAKSVIKHLLIRVHMLDIEEQFMPINLWRNFSVSIAIILHMQDNTSMNINKGKSHMSHLVASSVYNQSKKLSFLKCICFLNSFLYDIQLTQFGKALFTDRYTWQNFRLRFLRLVINCVESIYKTQTSRTKVLPCVTVDE